jgi:Sulfocyanin (SoxE) domain
VKLVLASTYNSDNAGFNFNGYDSGKMVVSVPDGWQVTVSCGNLVSSVHSCAIINKAGDQARAFPGLGNPRLCPRVPTGSNPDIHLLDGKSRTYRISCLVAGHDGAGMWDTLIVTAGREPQIKFG